MADVKISELTALTSPSGGEELVVNASGTTKKITITNATSASLPKAGGTMTGVIAGFESTGIDDNATSTAITIDASENMLVGKTTTDFGTEGIVLFHSNDTNKSRLHVTSDSTSGGYFNRLGNDGEAIRLYRQGNLVGGVGVTSAGAYITLGGTGAANTLDDYEEGTWNPVVSGASIAASQILGTYTKIGNRVLFQCYIYGNITSDGTTTAKITGLPFTTGANGLNQAVFYISHNTGVDGESIGGFMPNNNTELIFLNRNPNNVAASWINGSGKEVMVNGTYLTDS